MKADILACRALDDGAILYDPGRYYCLQHRGEKEQSLRSTIGPPSHTIVVFGSWHNGPGHDLSLCGERIWYMLISVCHSKRCSRRLKAFQIEGMRQGNLRYLHLSYATQSYVKLRHSAVCG